MTESNQYNENNPTINWTEDEKYEVCKWENKWLRELTYKSNLHRKSGRVCDNVNDSTFATNHELNKHFQMDIQHRKQSWTHLCHICEYATNRRSNLTAHLNVHEIGKRYKCDQCNKEFKSKQCLNRHIATHQKNLCQICQICQKEFKHNDSFKVHIITMHKEPTIPCDECSQRCTTLSTLNRHKKTVHVFRSFKCDQCNKRYKTKTNLNAHIKSIHEKAKFSCNMCEYVANQINALTKHKESVHEKKKNWFCQACPYSCYLKSYFRVHMRSHTGEKPYQCKKCLIQFSQQSNLQTHTHHCTS